jgi:hypothetical protein
MAPVLSLLKKFSGWVSEGRWLSGHPDLEPLDLDRDFPEIERLFALEEWPFLRSDLEISHAQPWATARIAKKDGHFAGFFATHHFGTVGYLDMMIIAPEFRRAGVARPLYFATVRALRAKGVRSLVVHTTNDSARLIRLLGFRPGQRFVLLRREGVEGAGHAPSHDEGIAELGRGHRAALLDLDERVFGLRREAWLDALLAQPDTRFLGLVQGGNLRASLCLRPRREGAAALDLLNADDPGDLARLVRAVARAESRRLECFALEGSSLSHLLVEIGFLVPDFFQPIGPLVEWRNGPTGQAGRSPRLQSLSWF